MTNQPPFIIKLPTRYINLSQISSISFETETDITASINWAGLSPSLSEHLPQKDAEPLLAVMNSMASVDLSMYWEDKEAADRELNENPGAIMGTMTESQDSVLWLPE